MTHDPDSLTDVLAPLNPELEAYYSNKPMMWRNVSLIGICNLGWVSSAGSWVP